MKVTRDKDYLDFCSMLGGNIRYCRLKKGEPQKVIASHLGVTFQNVQKYEVGKIIPTAYRLKLIADYFKIKADDLLDPTFIHRSTKANEALTKSVNFDATKYEEFDTEYPPGSGALENDPKMKATYDAILEDK
jgi:transcriptional regulator with XRE-family HTH domain